MMRTALLFVAACAAPSASPSFQVEVAPILAARCVRCHGDPPIGGAPTTFRLDGYPDLLTPSGSIRGAGSEALAMASRAAAKTMPPRFPLDDDQIAILQRWADEAAVPDPPPLGDPRPGNRPPELVLDTTDTARWTYDLHDPDGDLVVGTVTAHGTAGDRVVANVHSGRGTIDWTALPPAGYTVTVELHDGGAGFTVDAPSVVLP
jgi:hypothetical protein